MVGEFFHWSRKSMSWIIVRSADTNSFVFGKMFLIYVDCQYFPEYSFAFLCDSSIAVGDICLNFGDGLVN